MHRLEPAPGVRTPSASRLSHTHSDLQLSSAVLFLHTNQELLRRHDPITIVIFLAKHTRNRTSGVQNLNLQNCLPVLPRILLAELKWRQIWFGGNARMRRDIKTKMLLGLVNEGIADFCLQTVVNKHK